MQKVLVGRGSCGIAAGADKIYGIIENGLRQNNIRAELETTGCIGMCYLEPIVDVVSGGEKTTFVKVDAEAAGRIVDFIVGSETDIGNYKIGAEDLENLRKQTRVALKNCGVINPEKIDDYINAGGYSAFEKCLKSLIADEIIEEIKISGLAGRGGAGFPAWFKWNAAKSSAGEMKYIICNADEGDPGAFMDRAVIEGDPHALIEGMLIAALAIGGHMPAGDDAIVVPSASTEGIIYVRAEYPLAITRLEKAIGQAAERGYLGRNILGTDFSFNLRIKAGAGAFVCGEETALIASLEGERGMPRLKPPFPAQKGYWGKPSNINNVETYANVAWIINNGGAEFAKMGTENSKGTKVFALTGKIKKGGLVEIPMGMTLRDVIFGVGGGIKEDRQFKAVQMGGPSGGCIPAELADTVIDYKQLAATGAIMGSGGMVVMDETTCMVEMARFFLDFTCKESCGKCVTCRIGTKRMLEILERIVNRDGKDSDIELLCDLGGQIREGSLCALGQTAPNPVLTTIKYFRNEYEDHIVNKKCTAKQCKPLLTFTIDPAKCSGCTLCKRNCPTDAISGEVKTAHEIDRGLCVKCGKCETVCRFGAIRKE